ncbi:FAD-dependent oxidoreductase [Pseudonocardia acaciae]|uniref:FAD-dependent oxidoreductase n=1 Tax=Pseudonocardia acaciae TaxID=551276 RepID=UPI0012EDD57D|nr:hypothetical protein [Pseudonocardia acaciae]
MGVTVGQQAGADRHAVVVGSGIAGLLAARVLSECFGRVTVLDRDRFPAAPDHRAGAPQSHHVHGLQPRGAEIITGLFPGLAREVRGRGAAVISELSRVRIVTPAGLLPLGGGLKVGEQQLYSRYLLEWCLRRSLVADHGVAVAEGIDVVGLAREPGAGSVTGVRVRRRAPGGRGRGSREEEIAADLVVDASGRGSHAPRWLAELGYPSVPEELITSRLAYASRFYARPASFPPEFNLLIVNGRAPNNPAAGLIQDVEDGRWHVTLGGLAGVEAPTDEAGFLEHARALPDPSLYEALRVAAPLTPIRGWRTPSNRIRRYERLPDWPSGFIVTGDAACAFNPIYGQGMTVAAMDALTLRECLADHDHGRDPRFARGFQRRLARTVAPAWLVASTEDLRWPGVTSSGARARPGTRLVRGYLDTLLRAAVHDPTLADSYFSVITMMAHPRALFAPRALARVVWGTLRGSSGLPGTSCALSAAGLATARRLPSHRLPSPRAASDSAVVTESAPATRPGDGEPATASGTDVVTLGRRFHQVLRDRDLDGFRSLLAPTVTMHSPYLSSGGFVFEGPDESSQALGIFMREAHELAVTDECAGQTAYTLTFNARLRRDRVDGVFLIRPDAEGRIHQADLFIRGFVGLSVFGRVFGPGFTRPYSRVLALLPTIATVLVTMPVRAIDWLGGRIVKHSIRRMSRRSTTVT